MTGMFVTFCMSCDKLHQGSYWVEDCECGGKTDYGYNIWVQKILAASRRETMTSREWRLREDWPSVDWVSQKETVEPRQGDGVKAPSPVSHRRVTTAGTPLRRRARGRKKSFDVV